MNIVDFNEFRENLLALLEIISTKEKIKISNICISYYGLENGKVVRSLARRAKKEYLQYLEKESFNDSLFDRNYGNPDYDYMSDVLEIINIKDNTKIRINYILLGAISLLLYNLPNDKRDNLYNKITNLT